MKRFQVHTKLEEGVAMIPNSAYNLKLISLHLSPFLNCLPAK